MILMNVVKESLDVVQMQIVSTLMDPMNARVREVTLETPVRDAFKHLECALMEQSVIGMPRANMLVETDSGRKSHKSS